MLARIFVIPLLALVATADAQQSEPTLLELARLHNGTIRTSDACGPIARLADIVSRANLIVYGTVVAVEPRLSSDGRRVLTDYSVQPFTRVYDDVSRGKSREQMVVFTAGGGTIVVEGLRISDQPEHNGRSVTMNVGDEVILM